MPENPSDTAHSSAVTRRQALRLTAAAGGTLATTLAASALPAAAAPPVRRSGAGMQTAAAGTVTFDDDFSGTLGAWTVTAGTVDIDNGTLLLHRTVDGPTEAHAGDPDWRDYTLGIDVNVVDGGNYQAALLFRIKNATTQYNLAIRSATNPYDPNQIVLYRVLAGQYLELARDNTVVINSNQFYHFKISILGNRIEIFFNSETTPRIAVNDDSITYGAIGVNTYNTTARFDNVHVDVTATGRPITALTPTLHYRPAHGWLGDGHPIYRDGLWQMLFLEVPEEPARNGLDGIHQSLATSRDLVHWTPAAVSHTNPNLPWWAIANIDFNGKLYSLHNDITTNAGYALEISDDARHWTSYPHNPVFEYSRLPGEARDPFIYRRSDNEFWLIMAIKRPGVPNERSGAIYYSKSDDLVNWSDPTVLYDPQHINVPEVPDLFALGGRYYLVGSWGTDRVGTPKYRTSNHPQGPWTRTPIEQFDGSELLAGTTVSNGSTRVLLGWLPTYVNDDDYGDYQWGGHLAFPREIHAGRDGQLYTRLPQAYTQLRQGIMSKITAPFHDNTIGQWNIRGNNFRHTADEYAEITLPESFDNFEMTTTLRLGDDAIEAGLMFRTGDASFSGYEVAVDIEHQQMYLRRHLEKRRNIATTNIQLIAGQDVQLRVFVDGDIIEAFLDNKFSLVGRAHIGSQANRIGFYTEGGRTEIVEPKVYKIR